MATLQDLLHSDIARILGLLAVGYVFWTLLRGRMQHATVRRAAATCMVYCLHCNWEGQVERMRMRCARCGGVRLSLLTT